jgi:hypothetical protein
MFALALISALLVASPGECYLVTSEGIDSIPCDFSAAATDALRYAAEDAEAARAERDGQRRRAEAARPRGPRATAFGRGSTRGGPGR